MARKTKIDQVEVVADTGEVRVRFYKLSSDGDVLGYHRMNIPPGADVDAQMKEVNDHLAMMGHEPVTDYQIVKDHAKLAQTPEVVEAYQNRIAEAAASAAVPVDDA